MGILSDRQIETEVGITPLDKGERKPGRISSGLSGYGYDMTLGYKFKVFSPIHATVIDPKAFDPKALVDVDLTPTLHNFDGTQEPPWDITCKRCGRTHKFTNWTEESFRRQQCPGHDSAPIPYKPDHLLIPPHSFVLAESVERFKIPRDTLAVVLGKSTYARCGLIVNCTPMEPEWEGVLTIELSNTTPLPMKVYPGEGIAQALFFRSDEKRETLYRYMFNDFGQLHVLRNKTEKASCRSSYADKKGKYQNQSGLTLPKAEPISPPPASGE